MGKKIALHNSTGIAKHVGPVTIMPGGTREVDADHLEGKDRDRYLKGLPPETEKAASAPAILALLENSIPNFTKVIAEQNEEGVYIVTLEQLDELNDGEQLSKNPRSGISQVIAAEKLRRVDEAIESNVEQLHASLQEMELQELHDQFDVYKDDAGTLAMVENVWREKLTALDDAGLTSVMETLVDGSRQHEILNEVIGS